MQDWLANQAVHPPSATASPKEPEDAQAGKEQLELDPIFKDRCYLRVSVLPRVDESSLTDLTAAVCRQNLVEFERQIK